MGDLSRWQRVMVHVAHERPPRDSMGIFHATSLSRPLLMPQLTSRLHSTPLRFAKRWRLRHVDLLANGSLKPRLSPLFLRQAPLVFHCSGVFI
ncbi:hypothetical protein B296_00036094 [Ensete ventricosum]|uniref:Uncharacterized protein n=1 Tax=Ensete ventricosum TaxID=4639 RepID=A0A426ZS37_ENSVE|nr:hypothetical protein B296_00036094 [Ensete ventricosum]